VIGEAIAVRLALEGDCDANLKNCVAYPSRVVRLVFLEAHPLEHARCYFACKVPIYVTRLVMRCCTLASFP
jgi:hypothetical protein